MNYVYAFLVFSVCANVALWWLCTHAMEGDE